MDDRTHNLLVVAAALSKTFRPYLWNVAHEATGPRVTMLL